MLTAGDRPDPPGLAVDQGQPRIGGAASWEATISPTGKQIVRVLAVILGTVLVIMAVVGTLGGNWMRGGVEDVAEAGPRTVSLLEGIDTAGADVDLILGPIVTGGEPMVVSDDAWIVRNADALWFE